MEGDAMIDRADALRAYVAALQDSSPERLDALAAALAPDVVVVGLAGAGTGPDGVRDALVHPARPGLLDGATWSGPVMEAASATVNVTLAAGRPIAALTLHVQFNGEGQIRVVEQEMRSAPPPAPTPLRLTEAINAAVAGALLNGTPIVVAYVDGDGAPHLSLRGSTQPYGDTQLALWVRDPAGGLLAAIKTNPHVALFYRDPATRTSYQFAGRAHADGDPAVRERVFTNTPEPERNTDARRLGVAVIVDLDRVEGMGPDGRLRMER
jgi:hypothetical protein